MTCSRTANPAPDTAEPRQLLDGVLVVALQQAADHEALAIPQFNGRRSATNGQRRHGDACIIWLTSGSIFMLIRPRPSTVGVNARPTPYFL